MFGFGRFSSSVFEGKVVLITGGSRGLGLCLARAFARRKAKVFICARDRQELEWAREKLAQEKLTIEILTCDVSVREEVVAVLKEVENRARAVDVLVNNAGIIEVGPWKTHGVEGLEEVLNTNFWGAVHATEELLRTMSPETRKWVVNITSIGGVISAPHLLPYTAAKFALVGYSKGLSVEHHPKKVSVTTVIPGLMRTGSFVNAIFKGRHWKEFRWFSISSVLPLLSMNAQTVADRIVKAAERSKPLLIPGLPNKVLVRLSGMVPGLTLRTLRLANRLILPQPPTSQGETETGGDLLGSGSGATRSLHEHWGARFVEAGQPSSTIRHEGN
jgi:short-subunit dehydrogenase